MKPQLSPTLGPSSSFSLCNSSSQCHPNLFVVAQTSCLESSSRIGLRESGLESNLKRSFKLYEHSSRTVQLSSSKKNTFFIPLAKINIDRRYHLEQSFIRQLEEELRAEEGKISCPVNCVREVKNFREFEIQLQEAEKEKELVIVDFYNSSCGSCKYILHKFIKLCKNGCGDTCHVSHGHWHVRFIKHNVRDDYDDLTDLAKFYGIKVVPMFAFFMDGVRVDQFATRDKERLLSTINRLLIRYNDIENHD